MRKIFILFLVWALLINFFALISENRVNLSGDTSYTWINSSEFPQTQDWDPTPLHARWDGEWYLDIAENGYSFRGENKLSNIVFFPLYPLLIWILSLFGFGLALSGWILSLLFLFLAGVYLYKLSKEFHPDIDANLPYVFLIIFPTAFFLNAVYTESLFLFLSVSSFYYCFKKDYWKAGVLGFLSALTRITGVLLFAPLIFEYLRENRKNVSGVIPIFLIPLGTASFFIYHYLRFGDPLLFFKVESWWGRGFSFNTDHFLLFSNSAIANFALDLTFLVFALVALYFVWKKLRASYAIYMLLTLLVALSSGTLMSIGRYILVLFPIFILASKIKNENLRFGWVFASILFLALYTILFANNYWAG